MWDDAGPDASYNNSQPKWLRQYVGCKYVLMTLLSNQHTSCFWGAAVAPFTQPGKWRLKTLRLKSLKNLKNVMSSWHGGKHPNIFNENHILPCIEKTWKKQICFHLMKTLLPYLSSVWNEQNNFSTIEIFRNPAPVWEKYKPCKSCGCSFKTI